MINQKKAKALRRALGFRVGQDPQYSCDGMIEKFSKNLRGDFSKFQVFGTIRSTGARRTYQNVKRQGLANHILKAGLTVGEKHDQQI